MESPEQIYTKSHKDAVNELRSRWILRASLWLSKRDGLQITYKPPTLYDGVKATGRKKEKKPIWPTVYASCYRHKFDHVFLIDCFWDRWFGVNVPSPTSITSEVNLKDALSILREHRRTAVHRVRNDPLNFMMAQKHYSGLYFDPREGRKAALLCMDYAMSPLFRFIAAYTYEHPEIAERYKEKALVQFKCAEREYTEAWREMIKPEILSILQSGREVYFGNPAEIQIGVG